MSADVPITTGRVYLLWSVTTREWISAAVEAWKGSQVEVRTQDDCVLVIDPALLCRVTPEGHRPMSVDRFEACRSAARDRVFRTVEKGAASVRKAESLWPPVHVEPLKEATP